jgi:hypothetical protein
MQSKAKKSNADAVVVLCPPKHSNMLLSVSFLLSLRSMGAYMPLGSRHAVALALYSTNSKATTSISSTITSTSLSSLYGGDLAGHAATFSSSTGKLIRVPDHLVPPSLIEWGQVPSCLEVLVSEDFDHSSALTRRTLSVVPEVGCGVDNLDTIKTKEVIDMSKSCLHVFQDDTTTIAALDYELPRLREDTPRARIETTFAMLNDDGHRMRVVLDITLSSKIEVQSPVMLILERRTSTTSSQGTIADGGGLDARTVARLLGDELRQKPFADETIEKPMREDGEVLTLSLPGNVTIAYDDDAATESWILNVSHLGRGKITRRFGPNSLHATVEYTN